jgi:plastocyanin
MTRFVSKGVVAVAVLGLAAAACSKSSSSTATSVPTTPAEQATTAAAGSGSTAAMLTIPAANNKGSKSVAGQKSFELEADTDNGVNYYKPSILEGTPGQTITLELKNDSSSVKHNFTLAEQNLNVDLAPGKTQDVKVTFPDSGVLQFHCEYHVSTGMIGELKVA